jgi:hypothetical protein
VSEPINQDPTFKEAMADALRKSRVANGVADDAPLGVALLGSVGGVRGIIESVLPTLVFLVLHLITKDVVLSTLIPVGVAVLFVIARVIGRSPVTPAISGAVILGVTAALAILTNRAENNFVPGLILNGVFLVAMVVSLVVRRPLVGVLVALLMGEQAEHWRENPAQRRALTVATLVWTAMFALRVAVELPLYLAANASGLAVAKLVLGVPLYAVVLLLTWLIIRSVFPTIGAKDEGASPKVS